MKIKYVKDSIVFIALKRVCDYLINNVWNSHMGAGDEIGAEFELAKQRSKRYKDQIKKLSKLDIDLNWGDKKTKTADKRSLISHEGDFNPWYDGNLTLEDFLDSIESIFDFIYTGNDYINDREFIHYFELLANFLKQNNSKEENELDFWKVIHKDIVKVSKHKYQLKMYSECVRVAFVEIEDKVRKIVKEKTKEDLSGDKLMRRAFSPNKPIIYLGNNSDQIGKDIQRGYMDIFAGSMVGIRNPKSHKNFEIEKNQAIHFLFLTSLLMTKLDESKNL